MMSLPHNYVTITNLFISSGRWATVIKFGQEKQLLDRDPQSTSPLGVVMSLPFDHVTLRMLISLWISCFKFFMMIKFSKFCKKQMPSRQLRCLQTFCICTRNKLIKAQAISPLTFFSLNSFMNTKTEFKSSHRGGSIKSNIPKTFGIFTGKHLYQSLYLIKLQAYRT